MQRTWNTFLVLLAGIGALTNAGCQTPAAKNTSFSQWPAGASPQEVGKRVAENFVVHKLEFETRRRENVIYPEACAWYGSLTVADLTKDNDLKRRLIQKFDAVLTPTNRLSDSPHVDYRVLGIVPLQIYQQTHDPKYLELGKKFADRQWERTTPDGITTEARYWIDDMFMITALQVQAYRATGDNQYLDRAALTMSAYLDRLQQTNGLFFHAPDARFYWSRGNGWVAAGIAELLRSLPSTHPQRARIIAGNDKMMAALLRYQGEDGLWRQLIDDPESWPETSGTGMFAFAMVTGVKNGWLDAGKFGPAARKAWLGLVKNLDENANVANVCAGTPKGFTVQYYLDRPRVTGDPHGQSPIMWTASALMR